MIALSSVGEVFAVVERRTEMESAPTKLNWQFYKSFQWTGWNFFFPLARWHR